MEGITDITTNPDQEVSVGARVVELVVTILTDPVDSIAAYGVILVRILQLSVILFLQRLVREIVRFVTRQSITSISTLGDIAGNVLQVLASVQVCNI